MQILNVEPKDVHIAMDLSIKETRMILDVLDHAKVEFNGTEEPGMIEAHDFVKNRFFKQLEQVVQDVERNG